MKTAAEKTCGKTKQATTKRRETWWWSDEVKKAIKIKPAAFKGTDDEERMDLYNIYRETKTEAKRTVASSKEKA
jgi:hypothetical protein